MSNPFAALDEVSEGSSNVSKKQEKKVEQPKTTQKTTEKPKEVSTEKPKPKPKVVSEKPIGVTQDGFEQVAKSQRGGRPQRGSSERGRGSSERGRGGDRGSGRGRGTSRGGRGGDRGNSRGGFTKPPRTDSNTGSEETVSKDVREDKEKHIKKTGFRNERTGEPREGHARGRGRFHDHHLSGTGTRGGFKKRGGGGHNWGTSTGDVEVEVAKEVEVATEGTEEKKEEVVDPVTLSEDQKKVLRRKRKEAEKKERKGVKKDDSKDTKSDELSIDQVKVTKVDPNQKTFEEYQKEKNSKKAPTTEKKEEVKVVKTGAIDLKDLFKTSDKKKATTSTTTGTKSKSVPKVTNSNDFPTLK